MLVDWEVGVDARRGIIQAERRVRWPLCLLTGAEVGVDTDMASFRLRGGFGGHDDKGSQVPTSLAEGRGM